MNSFAVLFLLRFCLQFRSVESSSGLPCPLSWTSSGFGHIQKNTVNAGIDNVVSRIAVVNPRPKFYGGYLDLSNGRTYAVDESESALTSDTYSVLINPFNCSINWIRVESDLDHIPRYAVEVDGTLAPDQLSYIGRAPFEGTYKSGATLPGNSFLFAATVRDKKVLKFVKYEILTSEQPSLRVTLSKFDFSEIDLQDIQSKSKLELFSVTHAQSQDTDRIHFTLETDGIIDEYFNFVEGITDSWAGVSTIELNMVMWFGAPAVKQTLKNVLNSDGKTIGIRSERERSLNINTKFELARGEEAVGCAFAVMLEDYNVPFTARAKFIYDDGENRIDQNQIRQILVETGRNESTFQDLPDGSVQATISGIIHGRFVLRTYFYAARPEALPPGYGPCDGHLIQGP